MQYLASACLYKVLFGIKAWWAYTLYALLTGSIVYTLYRNHIRQIEKKQAAQIKAMVATQEEERKRISRDLHGIPLQASILSIKTQAENIIPLQA